MFLLRPSVEILNLCILTARRRDPHRGSWTVRTPRRAQLLPQYTAGVLPAEEPVLAKSEKKGSCQKLRLCVVQGLLEYTCLPLESACTCTFSLCLRRRSPAATEIGMPSPECASDPETLLADCDLPAMHMLPWVALDSLVSQDSGAGVPAQKRCAWKYRPM